MDIHVGRDHGRGMYLLGTVHENFHGMDLQVLRVILTLHALEFFQALICNPLRVYHQAAVNINGQFSLFVQFDQTLIDLLVELHIARKAGIKYRRNAIFDTKVNPALKRRVNLLIRQFHPAVQNDTDFRCAFIHISGHVSVLTHVIRQSRYRIRRIVRNAVPLKDLGIYPDAVSFPFLNLELGIRTDGVEFLLYDILSFKESFLHQESVTLLTGILFDIIRHHIQRFLLAVGLNPLSHGCVLKTYRNSYVHVAIDDAGHDELAAEICDLTFVGRKASFVAHIDELAVFYHK